MWLSLHVPSEATDPCRHALQYLIIAATSRARQSTGLRTVARSCAEPWQRHSVQLSLAVVNLVPLLPGVDGRSLLSHG
jgi:hypothetical protein